MGIYPGFMALSPLPIDSFIPKVCEILKDSGSLVLSAAPGAGKTTRIPPGVAGLCQGQVLVLEPRRMAALASAHRVAEEQSWRVGSEVGYWVRFDAQFTSKTKIIYLTEALLTRKLLEDPDLKEVSMVILDEFHERSLHTDLALGLLKELQALARPDLKLIVMSATMDAERVSQFLDDAPIIEVPGLLHPLEIQNEVKSQLLQTGPEFIQRIAAKTKEALSGAQGGDVLVFLPGVGEINRTQEALSRLGVSALPLHGRMPIESQRSILFPGSQRSGRRVILSTNVAESAVTVDGVATVIDSGLERVSFVQSRTGSRSLRLQRISKASARQRAGRSARQQAGRVFQMWNSFDERTMPEEIPPEILREDLSTTLLSLARLGVSDFRAFSWFDAPSVDQLKYASEVLLKIGALESLQQGRFRITDYGLRLLRLPLSPRLAHLVLASQKLEFSYWGVRFAAILQEPHEDSPKAPRVDFENDLLEAVESLQQRRTMTFPKTVSQIEKILNLTSRPQSYDHSKAMELFLEVFPDRLCRRRKPKESRAVSVSGKGFTLSPNSQVKTSSFFIAADTFEKDGSADLFVSQAVGLTSEFIDAKMKTEVSRQRIIRWDETRAEFLAFESKAWRGIAIEDAQGGPPTAEEAFPFLVEKVGTDLNFILQSKPEFSSWWERYSAFKGTLLLNLSPDWIEALCYGERSWKSLIQKDWVSLIEGQLPTEELKKFNASFPASLELPSGKWVQLIYSAGQAPRIECKMQELYGMTHHPMINGQAVSFHLLGPNQRPVQITSDIPRFWNSSYPEIRKELRSRYPKHHWPENPLLAEPSIMNPNRKRT